MLYGGQPVPKNGDWSFGGVFCGDIHDEALAVGGYVILVSNAIRRICRAEADTEEHDRRSDIDAAVCRMHRYGNEFIVGRHIKHLLAITAPSRTCATICRDLI